MIRASVPMHLGAALVAVLVVACAAPASSPIPSAAPAVSASPSAAAAVMPGASPSLTLVADPWTADLDQLDAAVRQQHVAPFVIHTEAEWEARLAAVRETIADASPDEQLVQIASLVGLLDTHSALVGAPGGFSYYPLVIYPFSDGWHVTRSRDASLIGARVVSIGGVPMDEVAERLTPFVAHDNESGLLDGLEWLVTSKEYLHGAGIVADPAHPAFELELRDGTTRTLDLAAEPQSAWEGDLATIGWLMTDGDAPEAVARRDERTWTRLDKRHRAFLVAVNDYGDMTDAIDAMQAALDDGRAERVVLDMRYLRGGNGDIRLVEAMAADPRLAGAGGLTVLIGRENVSAATQVAALLDRETEAVFLGEMTPARADNFLCPCADVTLANSGFVIELPTVTGRTGDLRPAIKPDQPMTLSAADFYAGRDPVLAAALAGR